MFKSPIMGNILVLLNLQQMNLILKNCMNCYINIFLLHLLFCRSCYPMFALYEFKLFNKYSTISLFQLSFSFQLSMFLRAKITLYFNYQRDGLCLQVLRKHFLGQHDGMMQLQGKAVPEIKLVIGKTEISDVKNISSSRGGVIFTCNQK